MALCWVKAGKCGQETSVETHKVDPTHVVFDITTTCEHIQVLADELVRVDVRSARHVLPAGRDAGLHAGGQARLPQQLHRARRDFEDDGGGRWHLFAGRLSEGLQAHEKK